MKIIKYLLLFLILFPITNLFGQQKENEDTPQEELTLIEYVFDGGPLTDQKFKIGKIIYEYKPIFYDLKDIPQSLFSEGTIDEMTEEEYYDTSEFLAYIDKEFRIANGKYINPVIFYAVSNCGLSVKDMESTWNIDDRLFADYELIKYKHGLIVRYQNFIQDSDLLPSFQETTKIIGY